MKITEKNETNENFIEMNELSKMIMASDRRTAIKWCEEHNLPILPIGKKKVTYRFLVIAELDKRIVQLLKKQHPKKWEELYKLYKEKDRFGFVTESLNTTKIRREPINQIKPKSKFAKNFAEE